MEIAVYASGYAVPGYVFWGADGQGCCLHTRHADIQIAVLERGLLIERGETAAPSAGPDETYTRRLMSATPELPAGVAWFSGVKRGSTWVPPALERAAPRVVTPLPESPG